MSTTITRRFEWDSGHRVLGHEGKCKHLHGHRYVAEVTVTAKGLDQVGRIIDFSVLKDKVGHWIDSHWDHNILLHEADPLLDLPPESSVWMGRKPAIFPDGMNPTAENIALILYSKAQGMLAMYDIDVVKVRVYETPSCFADYEEKE